MATPKLKLENIRFLTIAPPKDMPPESINLFSMKRYFNTQLPGDIKYVGRQPYREFLIIREDTKTIEKPPILENNQIKLAYHFASALERGLPTP